jgi:MYXO-CTERM domain-containing protein
MSGAVVVGAADPAPVAPMVTTPVAETSSGPTAAGGGRGAFAVLGAGALVLRRRAVA